MKIVFYEPMTDCELAKALGLDENELAEAFGYSNYALVDAFGDEEYAVDYGGLELLEEGDLALMTNGQNSVAQGESDDDIAASHGYGKTNGNLNYSLDADLANANGYHQADEISSDPDDSTLALAFGYGKGDDTSSSQDDADLAAEFGYYGEDENSEGGGNFCGLADSSYTCSDISSYEDLFKRDY